MAQDRILKQRVSQALTAQGTRVAVMIAQLGDVVINILDEQPPVVIEAMLDHWKASLQTERRESRRFLRQAMIVHLEAVLEEAKARERQLYQGITGEHFGYDYE
jgi:hypothetical protein